MEGENKRVPVEGCSENLRVLPRLEPREMCFGQILYDGEPRRTEVRGSGACQSNLLTMGIDSSHQRKLQSGAIHDLQRGLLSCLNAKVPCTNPPPLSG